MTRENFFYTWQVCHYLNLLASETIFTIESKPFYSNEDDLEVTTTGKYAAYNNELDLLIMLLDNITMFTDDRADKVVIR